MKIIIDDKIPYIRGVIEKMNPEIQVVYLPGKAFTTEEIRNANALIIRTRTHCNKRLLQGSQVKFIATATIGYDHIDTVYCKEAGIYWTNCPGCNSASVQQYIYSVLLLLQQEKGIILNRLTLGIVGVGNVGKKIAEVARELDMKVLCCDPPRAEEEQVPDFHPIEELIAQCNIITFHTPLIREGKYSTYHLVNEQFFESLAKPIIIINTSRGEVVDNAALLTAINAKRVKEAVLDVWENEPFISLPLLKKVFIGTPHIAGYSADGKANATRMSLTAFCDFFHLPKNFIIEPPMPSVTEIIAKDQSEALLKIYDPRKDSKALKDNPTQFEYLRGNYPLRRQKETYTLIYKTTTHENNH